MPGAHLRRLQARACLRGLHPAPPEHARVLELGCGAGALLLPLALEYPDAAFIGCDLADQVLADTRARAQTLCLENIDLRATDLSAIDASWGRFDYILCHDVFSWVAPGTQRRILDILARHLAPHGVAYVSHDALPGWHLHEVARQMMRHHTRHLADFRQKVAQARAMLSMAAEVQDQDPGAYASLIRDEYMLMSRVPDEQLYHLISEPQHHPLYFHEFVDALGAAGLQWLGEAGPGAGSADFPDAVQDFLDQSAPLERQQYTDFLGNRSMRQAMVCHADLRLHQEPDPALFRAMWIGLTAGIGHGPLCSADAGVNRALHRLDAARPRPLPYASLFDARDDASLAFMLKAFGSGAIDATLTPFGVSGRIDDYPRVSPLARLDAREHGQVTSQTFAPVSLHDLNRFVVALLDGSRDRAALVAAVADHQMQHRPAPALRLDAAGAAQDASALTDACLRHARDNALLLGDGTPRRV